MVIGFDILHTLPLKWTAKGLCYKDMCLPWNVSSALYTICPSAPFEDFKAALLRTNGASSHSEFLSKHDKPLWLNPDFFVSLPFKDSTSVSPTKATHSGMSPTHLQQAHQELLQLLDEGLIEPTTSPWACQAFFVNNRAEQQRGKMRLVINYQPLNLFLADNKFPLPQRSSLFQQLRNSKFFSKFDLKAEFWQLGIHFADHYKTTFCIPGAHYHWRILPFGLKIAPSAFQQAMTKIFSPLQQHHPNQDQHNLQVVFQ